jgi:hypothetical protein
VPDVPHTDQVEVADVTSGLSAPPESRTHGTTGGSDSRSRISETPPARLDYEGLRLRAGR